MEMKAIAQGSGRGKRAQGSERVRDVARERLALEPAVIADAADRRMRARVRGDLAGRREGPVKIVERGRAGWREIGEFERARGAFDVGARAAEARQGMSEEGKKRARRELDRGLQDEPGQRACRALAERAPRRILNLDAPSRELRR